jgi:hypothetical protein
MVQLRARAEGEPPPARQAPGEENRRQIRPEQFNPPKTFDIQIAEVVSIHRIVGSGE